MWENKSGAGADTHPVWTWWFLIYTLLSETLPLNVRIVLLDHFSNRFSSYVVCVCNQCRRKNQNRSTMSLTSPIPRLSDAFSSYRVYFIWKSGTAIIQRMRFFQWWFWQWWVWIWVPWYMHFSFCSGKPVGSVIGVGSGYFVPTGIESIGDVVLLCVFVPRVVEFKGGWLIEIFWRPKSWFTAPLLLVSKSHWVL